MQSTYVHTCIHMIMKKNKIPNKLLWDEEPLTSKDAIKLILC